MRISDKRKTIRRNGGFSIKLSRVTHTLFIHKYSNRNFPRNCDRQCIDVEYIMYNRISQSSVMKK